MKAQALVLALLAFAAGCTAQLSLPSLSEMKALSGCEHADWDTMVTNAALSECQEFAADPAGIACPAACAKVYEAVGAQCYAELTKFLYQKLGITLGDDLVLPVVNATLEACEMGVPMDPTPLVALVQAAFAPYPTCERADWEAVIGAGCSMQEALSVVKGTCPSDCGNLLSAIGADCLVDFFIGVLDYQGGVSDSDKAKVEGAIRDGYAQCVGGRRRARKMLAGAAAGLEFNPLASLLPAPSSLAAVSASATAAA
ncbi:hypothetical protein ABPG77_008090 [Micractinium sp. CCAP 211/92]